jgi:hypothetical protein
MVVWYLRWVVGDLGKEPSFSYLPERSLIMSDPFSPEYDKSVKSDAGDVCDCWICGRHCEVDASRLPTDVEIDTIIDGFNAEQSVKVEAPTSVEALFDKFFADQAQPTTPEYGPVWFTTDEIEVIQNTLRFKGDYLCEKMLKIIDPSRDAEWGDMSPDETSFTRAVIKNGALELEELTELYKFFKDEFGIDG